MNSLPYVKGSLTSKEAARSMIEHASVMQKEIYQFIKNRGTYGATCDEVESFLGIKHQTASSQIKVLKDRKVLFARDDMKRPTRSGRKADVIISFEYANPEQIDLFNPPVMVKEDPSKKFLEFLEMKIGELERRYDLHPEDNTIFHRQSAFVQARNTFQELFKM